ncbi:MAG: DUF2764 family protein [Planctomycetes bacterium]|nr:DUF2764 family protein [Planctomycetota bacterium]
MSGRNIFLLTALPPLGELGSAPPLALDELLEHVAEAPGPREILESLYLGRDLLEREAFLAGEREEPSGVVLSASQVKNEAPLPDFLVPEPEEDRAERRVSEDALWEAYFFHLRDTARRRSSAFLEGWVGVEVALRNALASARAKAFGFEPSDYVVAVELEDREVDTSGVVSEWRQAHDPLGALKILDQFRWSWLSEHEGWFTFGDDEIAAYGARLMLVDRWHRLAQGASQPIGEEDPGPAL